MQMLSASGSCCQGDEVWPLRPCSVMKLGVISAHTHASVHSISGTPLKIDSLQSLAAEQSSLKNCHAWCGVSVVEENLVWSQISLKKIQSLLFKKNPKCPRIFDSCVFVGIFRNTDMSNSSVSGTREYFKCLHLFKMPSFYPCASLSSSGYFFFLNKISTVQCD